MFNRTHLALVGHLFLTGCAVGSSPLKVKVGEAVYLVTKPEPLLTREVTALTTHRSYVSASPGTGVALLGPHARTVAGGVVRHALDVSLSYSCPFGYDVTIDPQQPSADGRVEVFLQCEKKRQS